MANKAPVTLHDLMNSKLSFKIGVKGDVEILPTSKIELKQAQEIVGGYVQLIRLTGNGVFMKYLLCDEDGKSANKEVNETATILWNKFYGNTDVIVGDVILCSPAAFK